MPRPVYASMTRLNREELRRISRPTNIDAFLLILERSFEGEEIEAQQESPESPTDSHRGPSPPPRQQSPPPRQQTPPPAQQSVPEIIDLTSPTSSSLVAVSPSSPRRSPASSSQFTPLSGEFEINFNEIFCL
ncbi:hypothetical protein QAD02_007824 [Eretmocerus hayati]|uniref:Uncharacterized protein n=1 Tax=Eretmocerus hayati TaxID=131215 RepID=A0ACC2N764_9HYME|nr:hypothetical protein QAD02_007824 [Eretmocerus hayati]